MADLRFSFSKQIAEVDASAWNALVGTDYPFLRHEFLQALEASGSAVAATGWQPCHLSVHKRGETVAVMPLYRKYHSRGEYVFDWLWADAYQRHGLAYYPKLLSAIPFTPCEGPRLVRREGVAVEAVMDAVQDYARTQGCSSWHLLFPQRDEQPQWAERGLLKRLGVRFHWHNPGYASFAEFLGRFTSRRRKKIRREREQVREQGIGFRWAEGRDVDAALLEQFYLYYQATYYKRGQHGYLSRDFFERVLRSMPEQVLLIVAQRQGQPVAAAWFFKGGQTLYGRYWGCLEEYRHLHFETCYYQGIDYCIAQGLSEFDAGVQGEHKLLRGFEPCYSASYHWLVEPAFEQAIADFLRRETQHVQAYLQEAQSLLPYRQEN